MQATQRSLYMNVKAKGNNLLEEELYNISIYLEKLRQPAALIYQSSKGNYEIVTHTQGYLSKTKQGRSPCL